MAQTSRLVLEIDSRDAEQKAADTRKALEALEGAGLRVKPAMDKASQGLDKVGDSSEKAGKQAKTQAEMLEDLLGAIDPVTRRLGELDKQEKELAKNRKLGLLDADTFNEYQNKINATRTELGRFNADMTKTGMSAKATAAALRGVPAQFTDIAVSLQAGQSPLTVFLQQGGQLKDMFGGVGPAARALGGYVLGLVNPFTVAGAAVAALGVAYYQGSKEADAYTKALILTGNAAGTSSGAIGTMAANVSRSAGTIGAASAVLAQLAASSKIPASSFEMIATAAIKMEDATGKAASEIVADFEKLAKDPVKYSKELNDQLGYLTASTYAQIAALVEQGDRQGAANLAEKSYAEALSSRADLIKSKLGLIEGAWDAVKNAAKGAWDAALDVGREDTFEQKLIKLEDRLQKIRNASQAPTVFSDNPNLAELGAGESGAQTAITDLYVQKAEDERRTAAKAEINRLNKQSIEDQEKLNEALKSTSSNAVKLKQRYAEIEKQIESARRTGKAYSEEQIKQLRDAAAKQYADPKVAKPAAYTENAGQKMLDDARQRFAVLQQSLAITNQADGTKTLGTEAKKLIELETMLADLKTKGTLTASQKQILAMGELNLAQQKINAGKEKENQITSVQLANAEKLKAYQSNIDSQLRASQQGLDNKLAGSGLSDEARNRLQEELQIQEEYQRRMGKLTDDFNNSDDKSAGRKKLYDAELAMEKVALDKRLAQQKGYYSALNVEKDNWLLGTSTAWQNYLAIATDYNKQAQQATADVLNNTTTSISDQIQGLIKGTTSLGDAFGNLAATMANSVLGALSDIAAKWVVVQALKMAGISAETGAVVASESTKAAAKVAGDSIATGSTLASLATTVAANVSAAATTVASWLPAALVASIGSFGAAAVVGGTALVAAYALLKGFSSGGYTGPGGVNEPAGLVHKGEVVWSQADIKRSGGVASVEALRKGNVTPIRAAAAKASSSGSSTASAAQPQGGNTVNLYEDASRAGQVQQRTGPDGKQITDMWVSNIRGQGQMAKTLEQTYGLKRVGR